MTACSQGAGRGGGEYIHNYPTCGDPGFYWGWKGGLRGERGISVIGKMKWGVFCG